MFTVTGRTAITIHTGRHASFCTYFNAFPGKLLASLDASAIRALYRTGEGAGALALMRSTGRGLLHPVETVPIDSPQAFTEVSVEMGMDGLLDGGFFWFDAKATDTSALYIADAVGRCLLPNGRMTCTHLDCDHHVQPTVVLPAAAACHRRQRRRTGTARHDLLHRSGHRPCMRPTGLRRDGGRTRHAAHLHPAS